MVMKTGMSESLKFVVIPIPLLVIPIPIPPSQILVIPNPIPLKSSITIFRLSNVYIWHD